MRFEPSAWRGSDAVTYELAHDALNTLTAMLFARSKSGVLAVDDALSEASTARHEFNSLDAFDRDAIDDFYNRVEARIDDLRRALV